MIREAEQPGGRPGAGAPGRGRVVRFHPFVLHCRDTRGERGTLRSLPPLSRKLWAGPARRSTHTAQPAFSLGHRKCQGSMPLTLEELEDIQADCLADDVEIVFEKMSLWDETTVREYFENGGQLPEVDTQPPAASGPMLPPVPEAEFKRWFPKWKKVEAPGFRIVCFHNAGSSESVWTGRGLRTTVDNPFVLHCRERGGELLALELPGREARRAERRETELQRYEEANPNPNPNPNADPDPHPHPKTQPNLSLTLTQALTRYAAAVFDVLAPLVQRSPEVPYVLAGHSMGTWLLFELTKLMQTRGIPLPAQVVVSGFCAPDVAEADRPWSRNGAMSDEAFKEECRGWDVNAVVFAPPNWPTYSAIMRDDFTLFDSYVYSPAPAPLPVPVRAFYAAADKRVKQHHVEEWRRFTSASFSLEEIEGNHLFFYDVPHRAAYMNRVLAGLPAGFGS